MKNILILATTLSIFSGSVLSAQAQGTLNFFNNASTLISIRVSDAALMPSISSGGTNLNGFPAGGTFYFAIFLAPSTTVNGTGIQSLDFYDPRFQTVGAYATNAASAEGRIQTRNGIDAGSAGGFAPGSTVDFVIRGWSANMGSTWQAALTDYNYGSPFNASAKWMGSSVIGNNLALGGGSFPTFSVMGTSADQVPGFAIPNLWVPEPSSLTLFLLGGLACARFRHRV